MKKMVASICGVLSVLALVLTANPAAHLIQGDQPIADLSKAGGSGVDT